MISASELRPGTVVRLGADFHKVLESVAHAGGGKAGSMVHAKLRSLATGHVVEKRYAPDDKVEDVEVERIKMQLLFREGDTFTFMHPESFEQLPVPRAAVGPGADFLKDNDECEVEVFEGKPLAVLFPDKVELRVTSTPAGLRGQDSTKEAALENGMTIQVPQFIKEGDRIHVDVETGKYLDRVSDREVKGAKFTVAAPPVKTEPPAAKPEPPKK